MSFAMGMMKKMMMVEHRSLHDFDTTVAQVRRQALAAGWNIPFEFPLQAHYLEHGFADMGRTTNLYLCNPKSGYAISRDDRFKPMFVMMPTAVSIYEDSKGNVNIARMRLGTMAVVFGGAIKQSFKDGEARLKKTLEGVIAS